jgi:hypothetical protein
MKIRNIKNNNTASVVPLILYVVTIFSLGAFYTLIFTQMLIPTLGYMLPSSDATTFILLAIYGIPFLLLVVGGVALIKEGLRRDGVMY